MKKFKKHNRHHRSKSMAKKAKVEIVVFLVILVVLLISLFVFFFSKNEKNLSENRLTSIESDKRSRQLSTGPSPSPGPTSVPYTLPSGPQTYRFSHGPNVIGPKIQTMTINPLDPQKGVTQTITLEIKSESPVQSAVIIVSTDSRERTLNLKLINGDSQKGTYTGSWQVDDTYGSKYAFRYILKSNRGTFDNTMYLR